MTAAESAAIRSSVRATATSDFNETSHRVEITPEESFVGRLTRRYFDARIKRAPVWHTRNHVIYLPKNRLTPAFKARYPDLVKGDDPVLEVRPDDLARETISPLLASVIFTFKRIEDKLPDFSGRSNDLFRNYWGINRSYHQWSTEEGQHSDGAEIILLGTGHLTQEALDDDYETNLLQTWEAPFPGNPRRMVLYACYQETVTGANYDALADRAEKEDAFLTAEVLRFISRDENYHSGGYRLFAQAFHEWDADGTEEDALHVARNFRMPAQQLMRDPRRNSMEIVKVGAWSKQLLADTMAKAMKGLGFLDEDLVTREVQAYWR